MKVFSIEANIGAGKTTLLSIIQKYKPDNLYILEEPIKEWLNIEQDNLLEKFYTDAERWSYSFQTWVFLTRCKSLEDLITTLPEDSVVIMERSWLSDRRCFAKVLREEGKISVMEYRMYTEWFDWLFEKTVPIDGHIYLNVSAKTCQERIKKRNRTEEETIPLSYLQKLEKKHEEWLSDSLIIDGEYDYLNDEKKQQEIVEQIVTYV